MDIAAKILLQAVIVFTEYCEGDPQEAGREMSITYILYLALYDLINHSI